MTEETTTEKRGPGRPRKVPHIDAAGNNPFAVAGLVRVEIISPKHAFGQDGRKYLNGETHDVAAHYAEQWIKEGRARRV